MVDRSDPHRHARERVIRFRVRLWSVVGTLLFAFGVAALVGRDLAGLVPLAAARSRGSWLTARPRSSWATLS